MTAQWYTIQILQQLQKTAEFHLKRQNFESFFPQCVTRKSKTVDVFESLFKGYGFVKFDIERDQWLSINGTRGVVSLLPKFLLYPKPMADGFIESLQENDPIRLDGFIETFDRFYPGMEVEISSGLLQGKRGTVVSLSHRSRLLEILFLSDKQLDKAYSNAILVSESNLIPVPESTDS